MSRHITRNARLLAYATIFISLVTLVLHTLSAALMGTVWDDAYMYVRYAHNMLSHGTIAWNVPDPSFGITSQLQLYLDLPFVAAIHNPTVSIMLGSMLGGILFLLTIPFLVRSIVPESEPFIRLFAISAIYAGLALATPHIEDLAASGMDTMLSLATLCFYVIMILRVASNIAKLSRWKLVGTGILGASVYIMRPDLVLFVVILPIALGLWSKTWESRARAWEMLGYTFAALAVILLAAWTYFGTPLPLPFYAKSGLIYGETLKHRFLFQPILQLVGFIDNYKYFFALFVTIIVMGFRQLFTRGNHAIVIGMVIATCASISYYLLFVLQVMGGYGRFYYPVLPILIALSVFAIFVILKKISDDNMRAWFSISLNVVFLAAVFTPLMWGLQQFGYTIVKERSTVSTVWHSTIVDQFRGGVGNERTWPCLDVFASLPDNASSATTEVGIVSVMGADKYLLDLSGLNDISIALQRTSAGQAVVEHHIDLVYLPWRQSYPELRDSIVSNAEFQKQYRIFSRDDLGSLDDVAILTSSIYAKPLEACLQKMSAENLNKGATPVPENNQFYSITLPFPLVK
jgi:hypothetical protein